MKLKIKKYGCVVNMVRLYHGNATRTIFRVLFTLLLYLFNSQFSRNKTEKNENKRSKEKDVKGVEEYMFTCTFHLLHELTL